MDGLTREMILEAVKVLNEQSPKDGQINAEGAFLSTIELFLDAVEEIPEEVGMPKEITNVFNALVEIEKDGAEALEKFCSGSEEEEAQEEDTSTLVQDKTVEEEQEKSDPKYNDIILPEVVKGAILSENQSDWEYNYAVNKCRNLFRTVREGGIDLVLEFLKAHEMLVNKKVGGKTWSVFCDEVGISTRTAVNWFDKYSLPFTKVSGPERKEASMEETSMEDKKTETKDEKAGEEKPIKKEKAEKKDDKNPRIVNLVGTMDFCATELDALLSGKIKVGIADKKDVGNIIKKGTGIIVYLHKLGVDVKKVYDTVIKPKK